jgi:hypothetical protein
MQFHLNGFKPGNPELSEAAEQGTEPAGSYESMKAHGPKSMVSPIESVGGMASQVSFLDTRYR